MKYIINNKIVEFKDSDILGVGGEGTVYRYDNNSAVKIYHPPKSNEEKAILAWRAKKLEAILGRTWSDGTAHPFESIMAQDKSVCGFRMSLIPNKFKEFKWLSQKKYRQSHNIDEKIVTRIFVNLYDNVYRVHANGDCIGDFNDSNDLFEEDVVNPKTLLVDIDNFQITQNGTIWNCIGLYQDYANPRFFKDVISDKDSPFVSNPRFEPEDDWYSFLVQFFKSLLCVHPYGGNYEGVNSLPSRAKKKISVFNNKVVLPPVALPFSIFSGELKDYFYEVFENGLREVFPKEILENYLLFVESGIVVKQKPQSKEQAQSMLIMEGWGNVIELIVQNNLIKIITNLNNKVYYHILDSSGTVLKRMPLFFHLPNAIYNFLGDYLIVSTDVNNPEIMILNLSGDTPVGISKFVTADYSGKQRVFAATNSHVYRIINSILMRGVIDDASRSIVEKPVVPVTGRTLIYADSNADRIFGFFRHGIDIIPWVIVNGTRYDLNLTELKEGEIVEEDGVAVRFSKDSLVVLRKTQLKGVQKLHIDEVDLKTTSVVRHKETQDLTLYGLIDDVILGKGFVRYQDDKVTFST